MKRKMIPVHSRSEIPHFRTDAEFASFWDTHELTEELLQEADIPRSSGPAARLAALQKRMGQPTG